MVLRRLRTVMDSYFSAPNVLENRFAALADLMDPPAVGTSDADRDRTKWGTWGNDNSLTAGGAVMRYHIDQIRNVYLPGRRSFLNSATLAGATVPMSQPANAANLVTIETVDFNPASGTQDHEYFSPAQCEPLRCRRVRLEDHRCSKFHLCRWHGHPGGWRRSRKTSGTSVRREESVALPRASQCADGQPVLLRSGPVQRDSSGARARHSSLRDAGGYLAEDEDLDACAHGHAERNFRITELNYAPLRPTPAESAALPGVVESDFEFIELMNIRRDAALLDRRVLRRGRHVHLPVVHARRGCPLPVVGEISPPSNCAIPVSPRRSIAGAYAGNLDNNGESVQIMDVNGENILDFRTTTRGSRRATKADARSWCAVRRRTGPPTTCPRTGRLAAPAGRFAGRRRRGLCQPLLGLALGSFHRRRDPDGGESQSPAALHPRSRRRLPEQLRRIRLRSPAARERSPRPRHAECRERRRHELSRDHFHPPAQGARRDLHGGGVHQSRFLDPVDLPVGAPVDLGGGIEQVTYRDSAPQGATPRYLHVRAVETLNFGTGRSRRRFRKNTRVIGTGIAAAIP
jgi:hypothetical protein